MYQTKFKDKLICAILYAGVFYELIAWIAPVWIIVAAIKKSYLPDFIKYHCYQAILFNMIAAFLPRLFLLLISFISGFFNLFGATFNSLTSILNNASNSLVMAYGYFIWIVAIYAMIWTLKGRYTYIPPLSQAVNQMLR